MNYLQELVDKTLELNYDGGRTSLPHVMFFFGIALQMRTRNILELGVREGGSTLPFLVASQILSGTTTSIDVNRPIFQAPNYLNQYWNFIQTDAISFLSSVTSPTYDLIYVDDWHSAEHVSKELELIDKISTPQTIILMHDTMPNSAPNYSLTMSMGAEWEGGGPYKALSQLDKSVWEWATIPTNHGMTILRKKGPTIIK